ncbi:MAG: hypothetical protein AAFY71_13515 [Bacteroidota bacterium]
MNKILALCLLILPFSMYAQASFPESWMGNWKGDLQIMGVDSAKQTIPMELVVGKHDSVGRWQWTIIYHGPKKDDIREYELVEIDAAKGHYQVDEKNSILLDCFYFNGMLTSRFEVDNSLLLINYSEGEEGLRFEVFWGKLGTKEETGLEVKENQIFSYPVSAYQYALLKKAP